MNKKIKNYILENIPLPICFYNRGRKIIWVNEVFKNFFGLKIEKTSKKCWQIYGFSKPCPNCVVKRAFRERKEAYAIASAKDQKSWLFKGTPLIGEKDNIIGVIEIAIEIPPDIEKKHLFNELMHTRDLLKTILENIPVMITRYDPEKKKLIPLNRACEKLFGWSKEEADEIDIIQEILPDPVYKEEGLKYLLSGKSKWKRFSIKTKEGKTLESVWSNFYLKDGTIIGIGIDIRELLEKEREIIERQERLELLINKINEAIWFTKMDGSVINLSNPLEFIYGIPLEEFKKNPRIWLDVVYFEDKEIAEESLKELMEKGFATAEYRIVKPNGEIRWIQDRKAIIYDERGFPKMMGGIINDVTESKRKEEERENLKKQLFQAQKLESIGRLAGGVAHDFNNMLSVILGYTQLALMKLEKSHPIYPDLEQILKATERSVNLTRQLLAFARHQPMAPKVLNLNKCVEEMFKMLKRLIGEEIEIILKFEENLWLY